MTTAVSSTLLYIEDNLDNIRLVQQIMRLRNGIELIVAVDGAGGLTAAQEYGGRLDLILLDHRLPDMSGREVLRALKADPVTASIPVAMLSGDTGPAQVDAMLALGAQDYLPKPFDLDDFLALIDRYCDR